MKLYLVRHGEAIPKDVDSECPLSVKGKKDIEALAKLLSHHHLTVNYFFHSGKLRAKETAEILAKAIHSQHDLEARDDLAPLNLVSPMSSELNQTDEDVMLVGHMPFMGKLLSKLITNYENNDIVLFQTGTIVCLERMGRGDWTIQWVLAPRILDYN